MHLRDEETTDVYCRVDTLENVLRCMCLVKKPRMFIAVLEKALKCLAMHVSGEETTEIFRFVGKRMIICATMNVCRKYFNTIFIRSEARYATISKEIRNGY